MNYTDTSRQRQRLVLAVLLICTAAAARLAAQDTERQNDWAGFDLSADGVHPNEAGYRIMAPFAERAIRRALRK